MNLHADAKLGLAGRHELVLAIEGGISLKLAAVRFSVSPATAHRWWPWLARPALTRTRRQAAETAQRRGSARTGRSPRVARWRSRSLLLPKLAPPNGAQALRTNEAWTFGGYAAATRTWPMAKSQLYVGANARSTSIPTLHGVTMERDPAGDVHGVAGSARRNCGWWTGRRNLPARRPVLQSALRDTAGRAVRALVLASDVFDDLAKVGSSRRSRRPQPGWS